MEAIWDWLGWAGSSLVLFALGMVLLLGSIAANLWVKERTGKEWLGMLAGLVAFVVLIMVFGPAINAVHETSCETADDYDECMEG